MKTTLVIMAAGMGARFGGGVKQLQPVGPQGELIIDYSIHDAIEAGFDQIIFVIRREIEEDFRKIIGQRVESVCKACGVQTAYACQSLEKIPGTLPQGRQKPWGTGQAVLAAKKWIDSPFAVINADDYYGKQAYRLLRQHLVENTDPSVFAMAGFRLGNTLSENGGVTRGICKVENGWVTEVLETRNVTKIPGGILAGGVPADENVWVSMNMWAFPKESMDMLQAGFEQFFKTLREPLQEEYLLPVWVNRLLHENRISLKLLESHEKWFGVTYQEDKAAVAASMKKLIETGVYSRTLYSDLKRKP